MRLELAEPGVRVATLAHTDSWWQGLRYGTVTTVGRKWLHVRMDDGRACKFRIVGTDGTYPRVPALRKVADDL